jgi:hypothetical protein
MNSTLPSERKCSPDTLFSQPIPDPEEPGQVLPSSNVIQASPRLTEAQRRAHRARMLEDAAKRYATPPAVSFDAPAVPESVEWIFRDEEDVRPLRPITPEGVRELNGEFWDLKRLTGKEQFEAIVKIGFRLRCWRDLFMSTGSWSVWRDRHLRIPADAIRWLTQVWDENEKIRSCGRYPMVRFRGRDGTIEPSTPNLRETPSVLGRMPGVTDNRRPRPAKVQPVCRRRRRLGLEALPERTCPVCGQVFRPSRADATTCSRRCRQWSLRHGRRLGPQKAPSTESDQRPAKPLKHLNGKAQNRGSAIFTLPAQNDGHLSVTSGPPSVSHQDRSELMGGTTP